MTDEARVLVAVVNNTRDLTIARERHWYRIPVASARKWLTKRWPPQVLALYQTKVFGGEAFAVRYYARVIEIREVYRWQLFPDELHHARRHTRYYQLILEPLQVLSEPIISKRWRRIVFIPTTWRKFVHAAEINDLYHESPLEDRLWTEFKRLNTAAERQWFVSFKQQAYFLDFALYCTSGKMDVETDGDTWHADPQRIPMDNLRDNDLQTSGWKVLRFNGHQIREEMTAYCLPVVVDNIKRLGGVDERRLVPDQLELAGSDWIVQPGLFDDAWPESDLSAHE